MSADPERPFGRTQGEVSRAAWAVPVPCAIIKYRERLKEGHPREFSCSLETGKLYDVKLRGDRIALLELYGDGSSTIYIIAFTATRGLIDDDEAALAAMSCIRCGLVPLLGRWFSGSQLCEDVSVAVDHGFTVESARRLARDLGQEAFLEVTRDGYRTLRSRP